MPYLVRQRLLVGSVRLASGANFDEELHLQFFTLSIDLLAILGIIHSVKIQTVDHLYWLNEFESNDHFPRLWIAENAPDHPQ